MRIVQITPGAGAGFQCENCLRDNALVLELRRRGHDVLMVPLYLPLGSDGPDPTQGVPIFFGGINVYLQQKLSLFRRTPRWIDRLFDWRPLLRWAARRAQMTKARNLGEPALSMLRGEEGKQVKELQRLVAWLAEQARPDLVILSNALLAGLVRQIKAALGCPIVCMLQDEDAFLDSLPEPYPAMAWETLRSRASDVDAFVAVSRYYGRTMTERLALPPQRVHVVPIGIEATDHEPAAAQPQPPVIGYLEQLRPPAGLDLLVEAFLSMRAAGRWPGLRLRVAGAATPGDGPFVESVRRRVADAGAQADVEFLGALDRPARLAFLKSLSVLSVPMRSRPAFGRFVVEALASGVPVVVPRVGALEELVETTGGGVLVEPENPPALASAIGRLLDEPSQARAMADRGRSVVLAEFTVERMADRMLAVCESVAHRPATG